MQRIIYTFITIILIACNKEDHTKELSLTTDVKCSFNNNTLSNNTTKCGSNNYNSSYNFNELSNKIYSISVSSKLNKAKAVEVINTFYDSPTSPSLENNITLKGLYIGNNTISTSISHYRSDVYSQALTPNAEGKIIFKDIIPLYRTITKKNINITPNCSIDLGQFKPYNAVAIIKISKSDLNNDIYEYTIAGNNNQLICMKNNKNKYMQRIYSSKEQPLYGVLINEISELPKIDIICKKHEDNYLGKILGRNRYILTPGQCLVLSICERDFKRYKKKQ